MRSLVDACYRKMSAGRPVEDSPFLLAAALDIMPTRITLAAVMPRLLHTLQGLTRLIDAFTEITGRVLSWLTLLMMVLVCAVIASRLLELGYAIALQESVTYFHAAVFLLGAAYTLKHNGHVRVDVFYDRYGPRTRAVVNLAGTLLFLLPLCVVIWWLSWDYVMNSWAIRERSRESGGLPWVYLLKTDRKSTRLNSSHVAISYAVFCLTKKTRRHDRERH